MYQHNSVSPYQVRKSNHVEGLSLSLLIMTSVINLLKASLTDSGVVPSGPLVQFFKFLELIERSFVIIIIVHILSVELGALNTCRRQKCCVKRNGHKSNNSDNTDDCTQSTRL